MRVNKLRVSVGQQPLSVAISMTDDSHSPSMDVICSGVRQFLCMRKKDGVYQNSVFNDIPLYHSSFANQWH